MKLCSRCKESKDVSCFGKDPRNRDGLRSRCRVCDSNVSREYQKRNKEKVAKKKKEYNKNHPEQIREWRENNKNHIREYAKTYRNENKEKRRIWQQNRRIKLAGVKGDGWNLEDEIELKNSYDNRCAYCGKKIRLSIDHIVPISTGGEHSLNNATPACKSCNSSKRKTPLLLWMYKTLNR